MNEPCIHDLDPATCGVCNGAEKRTAAGRREKPSGTGPVVEARSPGVCGECFDWIEPGEPIRPGGDGGWVHEECADEAGG